MSSNKAGSYVHTDDKAEAYSAADAFYFISALLLILTVPAAFTGAVLWAIYHLVPMLAAGIFSATAA